MPLLILRNQLPSSDHWSVPSAILNYVLWAIYIARYHYIPFKPEIMIVLDIPLLALWFAFIWVYNQNSGMFLLKQNTTVFLNLKDTHKEFYYSSHNKDGEKHGKTLMINLDGFSIY